jgi:hypothetical protein
LIPVFCTYFHISMNKAKFSFLLILLLIAATATITNAQQFGGNPPSIKWEQVNTPAAKVIFPAGLDSAGLRVANIVEQMNKAIQPTIGFKQRQVSILLQNQTTIPNAYVGLAPFRSEFFLTPEQNSFEIGSLPWDEQLAIHEFRHVQQYNNFNVGLSHALRIVFGEGGQAVGNELSIPNWFFEGDAVFNETHVSNQGRGRLPYFFNGFRALWADGRNYSYMKIRSGSYRDYTPDWYPLGYMLVSYGREKYGDDFWRKVTHDAAAYKGGFYPFEKAVEKYSQISFNEFTEWGFNYFKEQFLRIDPSQYPVNYWKYNDGYLYHVAAPSYKYKHFDADREYPAYMNDSTLMYTKSTYDHRPVFVIKTGDREKQISVRSVSLDNYFDYHDGKVVYAVYRPDLRWNYRDYSELMLLDVKTGKEKNISRKTKYFSPSFSPDGKTIVTVEESTSGKSALHLLNTDDGKLKAIVPNPDKLFFTYPKFYDDDKLISAVRNNKGKMSLALIGIKTGAVKYLLPFSYQPIVFPSVQHDTVYFSATSGINDRLFALTLSDNKLYELICDSNYFAIGNYEPAVSNHKLAWVSFTAFGWKIHQADKSNVQWDKINNDYIPGGMPDFNISALKRDPSTDLLATVVDSSLRVGKYHKSYHFFNFHSLIPTFNDPNYTFALAGENVLNTFQSQLSFTYNRNEGYKKFGFEGIYGALFPYISGGADYTVDRRGYHRGTNVYWNETDLHAGLELPLNLSRGKNSTYLAIGSDVYYSGSRFQAAYRGIFADRSYAYLNNYIEFSNSIQQAKQNIYPRLAQSIRLNYKNAVTGVNSTQFLASGTFYFPGILVNHNFFINVAHQQKGGGENVIDYSNNFPFSRGYTVQNLHNMNKIGANYAFPIAYPDAGIANTIYFLRIRGNLYYDYTRATDIYTDGSPFKANFRSTGAEVFFDTKWFDQESISFGFRYSYLSDPDIFGGGGHNRFEFIVPVSFF